MVRTVIFLTLVVGVLQSNGALAQQQLKGMVMEDNPKREHRPLAGANVYWLNSQTGTMTDEDGKFQIPFTGEYSKLVISFVGFQSDTLAIETPQPIHHWLQLSNELDEVVVERKRDALQKTYFSAQNIITVNSDELLKAACCNLSESFETNPSIDAHFSDAITGTKQIQMLGLKSPYLMITQENIPMVRGASQVYGLTFTPGTWVESIQITKGAGSVVNGYESISGQINTELVKPFSDHPLFVNGYANRNGRLELNAHANKKFSDQLAMGLYVHGNKRSHKEDGNNDGFLDAPLSEQINVMNRWQFQDPKSGWVSFVNLRFMDDKKELGQYGPGDSWKSNIDTRRFDSSIKLGYVFPELPFQSVGFQTSYSQHRQDSHFGTNVYDIDHKSLYSNLIFNSILGSTQHKFKTGMTIAYDQYVESIVDLGFSRTDRSAGVFFEYNYEDLEKLTLTAGLRLDTHNNLGTFLTPRLHLRYTPWEKASLRGSFGRGRRAASIFAENPQWLASARTLDLQGNGGPVYGFDPEDAWNFGLSFLQGFTLGGRPGNVSVDFYRTDFKNQIVVDWEDPRRISFYNLDGESYANSLQIEFNQEVFDRLEVRSAYKFYDVKTQYRDGLLQKPIQATHRFFLNLGYQTGLKENGAQWKFDYTLHSVGEQRLPNTLENPESYRLPSYSDPYSTMNAQVTKVFSKAFEVYVGGENLSNFKQETPVLGAYDPFGPYFDTSIVYAPIMGRMFYGGFRYKLN